MPDDSLDVLVRTTADTAGLDATTAATNKSTEALKQAVSETERYQQVLEQMAQAQTLANSNTVGRARGAEDSQWMAGMAQKKAEVEEAARYQRTLEQMQDSQAEGSGKTVGKQKSDADSAWLLQMSERRAALKGVKTDTEESTEENKKNAQSQEEVARAAEKSEISHRALHKVIHGLNEIFPGLGTIFQGVVSPMGGTVLAIVGAFKLLGDSIKWVSEGMGAMHLPDFGDSKVSQVNAMTEAFTKMNQAIRDAIEGYKSVDQAHDRRVRRLQEELALQKQLLEANKARDMAALEAGKGSMSDDEYRRKKVAIDETYAIAGIKAEQKTEDQIQADKARRRDELMASAAQKEKAAAKIHLPSDADQGKESDLQQVWDARKQEAETKIKEARERMGMIGEVQDRSGNAAQNYIRDNKFRFTYGTGVSYDDATAIERGNIGNAQSVIDAYNQRERQKFQRDQERKRRQQLTEQAAAEAAEAAKLDLEINDPDEKKARDARRAGQWQVAHAQSQARKSGLAAEEQQTPLGQDVLKAAELVKQMNASGKGILGLSAEERKFLEDMDRKATGARFGGTVEHASQVYGGAEKPERFAEVYGRTKDVAAIQRDAATAQALQLGQQVDDASKNQLLEHVRMLTGVSTTVQSAATTMSHVADKLDSLNAAVAKLEARMANMR